MAGWICPGNSAQWLPAPEPVPKNARMKTPTRMRATARTNMMMLIHPGICTQKHSTLTHTQGLPRGAGSMLTRVAISLCMHALCGADGVGGSERTPHAQDRQTMHNTGCMLRLVHSELRSQIGESPPCNIEGPRSTTLPAGIAPEATRGSAHSTAKAHIPISHMAPLVSLTTVQTRATTLRISTVLVHLSASAKGPPATVGRERDCRNL